MNSHMAFESFGGEVRLAALCTFVWSLTSMSFHMSRQGIVCSKRPIANATLEGLLYYVGPFVHY